MMMMMLMVEFVGGSHILFMREGVLECDLVWVVGGMVIFFPLLDDHDIRLMRLHTCVD